MFDLYEKDYIRDTKKNLSEANVEQMQNKDNIFVRQNECIER